MVLQIPSSFFFFQAEDGIRDLTVTGVQTCALPIFALMRADSKLTARQKPFAGKAGDRARRLRQKRASAAGSYRKRRKQYLRSGSTTRLDAAARPVRCPAG